LTRRQLVNVNYEMQKIKNLIGADSFLKGIRYPKEYVSLMSEKSDRENREMIFGVESESSYELYTVKISMHSREIIGFECDCLQYKRAAACKHVGAVLIGYKNEIFKMSQSERELLLSKDILDEFYEEPVNTEVRLKKQVNLTIEIFFNQRDWGETSVRVTFKIGEDKLYNLNNKLDNFLNVYTNKNQVVNFGKGFTYDPKRNYFNKVDEEIIQFLVVLKRSNPYYNFKYLSFSEDVFLNFLELLKNKRFTIENYGVINNIVEENPIRMPLYKDGDTYRLGLDLEKVKVFSSDYRFLAVYDTLYVMPDKEYNIINRIVECGLKELSFKEGDMERFKRSILPLVKNKVEVADEIKEEIVLGNKPDVKVYLDIKGDLIFCNLKFDYDGREIDYFDIETNVVRDDDSEKEAVEVLLGYGFNFENKKIFMEDYDIIGQFLEENLEELAKRYEVFTSNKLKDTNILKNNTVRSSFAIGEDNIMKYEFDLGGIANDEIVDILEMMKSKKKYYRLKSGDFINLDENDELKQLESLVEDMELSKKDIVNGTGVIPKYRAIYLDSVKKDKYNIITTNNLFDKLIENFNSYKGVKLKFSKEDKEILRDYQVVGVKWLYNIYKCGFGGILADEMGLGKSIQLIYFIKEVLKEKSDAKILIVAPTSLIYNWKNEFDKFGSELKYKVFAENKNLRKQELEHIEDLNIIITTYGLIRQDREIYESVNFELIAIDEAQNIKNNNAQMTKVVKELKANTKIALTGTPLENSVMELWSIFDFIMPGYLSSILSFSRKYNVKDVKEDDLKALDNLNRQIKPFILRRKKKDVVKELPDKIENNIYIELNPEQKKLYVALLEKTKKEMDEILRTEGFQKGNFKILQLLTKLRQLCIDPRIIYENYQGGSAKIDNLIELCKGIIANGHKILVFTSYKKALDIVNLEMTNNNISTYVIDGSVSSKKRMELVDKFNSDDTNVFLITLKAGGTGLNLTSADVVIHLDLWWNPQVENQATDRAHRIGQKNTVEVIKLISSGTIEERILELQNKKKILSDTLIEGEDRDKNIISKLSEKDIKRLLSLDNEDEE